MLLRVVAVEAGERRLTVGERCAVKTFHHEHPSATEVGVDMRNDDIRAVRHGGSNRAGIRCFGAVVEFLEQ